MFQPKFLDSPYEYPRNLGELLNTQCSSHNYLGQTVRIFGSVFHFMHMDSIIQYISLNIIVHYFIHSFSSKPANHANSCKVDIYPHIRCLEVLLRWSRCTRCCVVLSSVTTHRLPFEQLAQRACLLQVTLFRSAVGRRVVVPCDR